jgi:hypothetical protein
MRTFHVTIRGTAHVIDCHSVHHPDAVTPRWRFLGSAGTVLWSYAAEDVQACVEQQRVEVVKAGHGAHHGRSCGLCF